MWGIPLFFVMAAKFGFSGASGYVSTRVSFVEPVFVVVIMTIAATRPVLELAQVCMLRAANLGGGNIAAWWLSILTLGPLLGSLITEPAAMTISAALLAKQF